MGLKKKIYDVKITIKKVKRMEPKIIIITGQMNVWSKTITIMVQVKESFYRKLI